MSSPLAQSTQKKDGRRAPQKIPRYIFVTGGVLSGVGKGITAASIAALLKARGLRVSIQKCDQYLNVDAGTLNPAEHGEVFVTEDGAETDLDLGHYERFLNQNVYSKSSLMTGRILKKVIDNERKGVYLGKTVQVVPHVTGAIIEEIVACAEGSDVHIVEVGGTVGDIEGLHFIEAIRELELRVGRANYLHMHVVYIPYLGTSKEFKTKPAQHAVLELRRIGLIPDMLGARAESQPPMKLKEKLSLFCGVEPEGIVLLPNADSVYKIPLTFEQAGIGDYVTQKLGLASSKPDLSDWKWIARKATAKAKRTVRVAIVAKYLDNEDTYFSIVEALRSAGWKHDTKVEISWVNAEDASNDNAANLLEGYDGILVPGGFGSRGIEGKIAAADYAYTHGIPYLGICLGLQVAVIAAARRAGIKNAHSTEFQPKTMSPVVYIMPDQRGKVGTGGSMRLGAYDCLLKPNTLARTLYKRDKVSERHRHRFEVNQKFIESIENGGLVCSGFSPDETLVEVVEAPAHRFYIASQAHPEFTSRPRTSHPLFSGFVKACGS